MEIDLNGLNLAVAVWTSICLQFIASTLEFSLLYFRKLWLM